METKLELQHASALAVAAHRQASDVAGLVREFALKRCLTIQGRKYPPVEVWQAIANSMGCVGSATNVEEIKGGIRAIGEVRRVSDGAVIATGEGFVGDDEKTWASRAMFARRAMAQTRAISRACRAAFAFIVPMIDAGLSTTPFEEMEAVVETNHNAPKTPPTPVRATKPQTKVVDVEAASSPASLP